MEEDAVLMKFHRPLTRVILGMHAVTVVSSSICLLYLC